MSAICNISWFIFGGLWLGLACWGAGLLCAITIVGLPISATRSRQDQTFMNLGFNQQ